MILIVALLTLPFLAYIHTAPLPSFYNEWVAAVCGLGVLLMLLKKQETGRINIQVIGLLFTALAVLVSLQMMFGKVLYPSQGRLAILYLLGVQGLIIATGVVVNKWGQAKVVRTLAWSILLIGALNSFLAILQHWEIHTWLDGVIASASSGRVYANLAQPNHYASIQSLALVSLLYLYSTRRFPVPIYGGLAVLIVLGLVLAFSRTTWLYLLSLTLMTWLLFARERTELSRKLLLRTILLIPLFVGVLMALGWNTESSPALAESADRMTKLVGSSIDVRLAFIQEAWRIFLESPLWGVGYQQFSWQHFLQQSVHPDPVFHSYEHVFAANAHNLLFQFLAEFGLLGGGILIVAVTWIIRTGARNLSSENWPVYAMLMVLAIHSQFEYPLYYMYFLALLAVLLALVDDKFVWSVPRRMVVLPAVLAIVSGGVILATMLRSYSYLEEAYGGTSGQIVFKSSTENALVQASIGGFFEPEIDQLINVMPLNPEREGASRILLETSQRAVRHHTSAPRVYRHVLLLTMEGQKEEAAKFLGMAAKAYPHSLIEFARDVGRLRREYPGIRAFAELEEILSAYPTEQQGAA